MASVHRVKRAAIGGRGRHAWQVRYRDPERRMRSRTFATKAKARSFAATVETDKARGEYIDPQAGRVTFAEWAGEWMMTTKHLKPKTKEGYQSILRVHLMPAFGHKALASIRPGDVRRFISELSDRGLSPSRLRQVRHLLGMILRDAVENGAIARTPVVGVKVSGDRRREMQFLSAEQVRALADATPQRYRTLILLLAYGGLRWGEAVALRRGRCNLPGGRVEVREAVSETGAGLFYGATKTGEERSVAIPAFLCDLLAEHLDAVAADDSDALVFTPDDSDALVFTPDDPHALVFTTESGTPLLNNNFRSRVWRPALMRAGLPAIRIHDLRHSCASMLISQGANAKAIQTHLGHSTIAITFDVYSHMLPDDQARLAAGLDAAYRAAQ